MKITVVLPWYDNSMPSGGVLNVYGYVERLAKKGHIITIIYDCCKGKGKLKFPNRFTYKKRKINTISQSCLYKMKNIQEIPVYCLNDNTVPDADYVIATALVTVYGVKKLSKNKGEKVYFIQGFENWGKSEKRVYETYNFGMINLAVSKWLYQIVKEHAKGTTYYLPNAIDDCFSVTKSVEDRNPKSIGFMYVPIKTKGTYDLLKAIDIVHKNNPDIIVEAFGVYHKNEDIPEYIKYTYNPSREQLRDIYNRCAIFVCASWLEGFGLTAGESMKCGCCLVTTNNKGILDFSNNEKTALICEPKNIEMLAEKIKYIINDNDMRISIARAGNDIIQKFNWNNSIANLERILMDNKHDEK